MKTITYQDQNLQLTYDDTIVVGDIVSIVQWKGYYKVIEITHRKQTARCKETKRMVELDAEACPLFLVSSVVNGKGEITKPQKARTIDASYCTPAEETMAEKKKKLAFEEQTLKAVIRLSGQEKKT